MFRTSLCILFAIGCVKQPEPAATAEAEEAPATEQTEEAAPEVAESATPEDGKWIHYGSDSVENLVTAATLLDEPSAYMEGVVRVTDATITDVCQAKGCWLVIADGDRNMRIFTKDHGFVVAKDAGGSNCELEGTVVSKTVKKDFVEHPRLKDKPIPCQRRARKKGTPFMSLWPVLSGLRVSLRSRCQWVRRLLRRKVKRQRARTKPRLTQKLSLLSKVAVQTLALTP